MGTYCLAGRPPGEGRGGVEGQPFREVSFRRELFNLGMTNLGGNFLTSKGVGIVGTFVGSSEELIGVALYFWGGALGGSCGLGWRREV